MSVRPYSRHEFRAWLSGLPQDEPFCRDCRCPIAEYMTRNGWVGVLEWDNLASENRDRRLALAIDKLRGPVLHWRRITPRDVIALIDEIESRRAA